MANEKVNIGEAFELIKRGLDMLNIPHTVRKPCGVGELSLCVMFGEDGWFEIQSYIDARTRKVVASTNLYMVPRWLEMSVNVE